MSKEIDLSNKRIIISRTDSIGDVMLTLPLCAWIKRHFQNVEIVFLGNGYTKAVIECYTAIDRFIDWKEIESLPLNEQVNEFQHLKADAIIHVFPKKAIAILSKKAKIQYRIGTSHRVFHFLTCSHKVNFTRKKSPLHEAQLNFELLRPFGLSDIPDLNEIIELTKLFIPPVLELPAVIQNKLNKTKKCVILHPKSQGSAVEWGIENYIKLALQLEKAGFTIFFTGTEKEGDIFRHKIPSSEHIIDTTGLLTLPQLIHFISQCSSLVACSTGPLHIAGYLNIRTVGLFSPRKPIHPGRWKALGKNVHVLVHDENCPTCKNGKSCRCIEKISVDCILKEIV